MATPRGTADPHGPRLEGLPTTAVIPGRGSVDVGPFAPARQAALDYTREAGIDFQPPSQYAKVDPARATRIAAEYDKMLHAPNDPEVRAAYDAMITETLAQYQAIKRTGLKIEFIDYEKQGDPYAASPRLAIQDVRENNHLWVFPTDAGFGSDQTFDASQNPLLRQTNEVIGGRRLLANDVFRIVHDYFGHIKEGSGFRADGEENAWRSHSAMYTPLARRAMTTETRGQNSWVNYGPHGAKNRSAKSEETVFADQKTGLLPLWVTDEGAKRARGAKHLGPGEHPSGSEQAVHAGGRGRSDKDEPKYQRPTPIRAASIDEAVNLISQGHVVELADVRTVNTLLRRLSDIARDAKQRGTDAPSYDLCLVSVAGTNLFCAERVRTAEHPEGIPRLAMPQLGGRPEPGSEADKLPRNPWNQSEVDGADKFVEHMRGLGVTVETGVRIPAARLKASQRELVGTKVAAMMVDESFEPEAHPVFVSRDGYVVDGHHRWAAIVGRDAEEGSLGDAYVNATKIDAPISEVLHLANAWSRKFGIQPKKAKRLHRWRA